jgi:signal peptidase
MERIQSTKGQQGMGERQGWKKVRKGSFANRLSYSSKAKLLTKGDNNAGDDTELYAKDQDYLERKDIIGSVVAYMPFVGYVTIMLAEHPWLKTVMLGMMGLFVVLQRE